MEAHEIFSVSGGKYHKPAAGAEPGRPWRPTATACGITVTPLNYFETVSDAERYTGNRMDQYICRHCFPRYVKPEVRKPCACDRVTCRECDARRPRHTGLDNWGAADR